MRGMVCKRFLLTACVVMSACGGTDEPAAPVVTIPRVDLDASVNVQLGNTPVGSRPAYTITAFVQAFQGTERVSASVDSIILSYRLNDSPFVVGTPLRQTPFSSQLPFVVQAGDRYTLFARLYASAAGRGGMTATAINDANVSGIAVAASPPAPAP
jgi:hypothetical protein